MGKPSWLSHGAVVGGGSPWPIGPLPMTTCSLSATGPVGSVGTASSGWRFVKSGGRPGVAAYVDAATVNTGGPPSTVCSGSSPKDCKTLF
jgi:hypothetical protein